MIGAPAAAPAALTSDWGGERTSTAVTLRADSERQSSAGPEASANSSRPSRRGADGKLPRGVSFKESSADSSGNGPRSASRAPQAAPGETNPSIWNYCPTDKVGWRRPGAF